MVGPGGLEPPTNGLCYEPIPKLCHQKSKSKSIESAADVSIAGGH